MFNRKPEQNGPGGPTGGPPDAPNARSTSGQRGAEKPSVIEFGLTITGNLDSKGEIQIAGEVQGDVHAARIVVGERGHITGTLIANEIIVGGTVGGSIRGYNVTIRASSRVEGDIFHKLLAIEQGACFEGRARRSEDPMAIQQRANDMRPGHVSSAGDGATTGLKVAVQHANRLGQGVDER